MSIGDQVLVRVATIKDLDSIMDVENKAWPKEMAATKKMMKSRIETFSEGTLCAFVGNDMVGFICTEIINYKEIGKKGFNWYNLTDNGYIVKSHNEKGDSLYGINLSIVPSSYNTSKRTAASIIESLGKLIIRKRLKRAVFGARIPRYYMYKEKLDPHEYVFSRTKRGLLLDPELSLYAMLGIYPVRVVKEYFKDDKSDNYGVMVTWKNPYCKLTKLIPLSAVVLSKLWKIKIYKPADLKKCVKKSFLNDSFNHDGVEG